MPKPVILWDGQCGFCKYWVSRAQSWIGDTIEFAPWQNAHLRFQDIATFHFREAARLIEPDGKIYSGPGAVYRSLWLVQKHHSLWEQYSQGKIFYNISNRIYQWIANHRSLCWHITRMLWGTDPIHPRPYWIVWLLGLSAGVMMVVLFT